MSVLSPSRIEPQPQRAIYAVKIRVNGDNSDQSANNADTSFDQLLIGAQQTVHFAVIVSCLLDLYGVVEFHFWDFMDLLGGFRVTRAHIGWVIGL
jgi:hypothetical protein